MALRDVINRILGRGKEDSIPASKPSNFADSEPSDPAVFTDEDKEIEVPEDVVGDKTDEPVDVVPPTIDPLDAAIKEARDKLGRLEELRDKRRRLEDQRREIDMSLADVNEDIQNEITEVGGPSHGR